TTPPPGPPVPHGLGIQIAAAEREPRLPPRLVRRDAGSDQILDVLVEMEAQLLRELLVTFRPAPPRGKAAHRLLRRAQHQADCRRQALPVDAFVLELRSPGPREAVELRLAPGLGLAPLGPQPAAFFEAMQRWIQRALLHLQHVLRDLLQPLSDGVAVDRPQRGDLEDQQIE